MRNSFFLSCAIVAVCFTCISGRAAPFPSPDGPKCGKERWDVKMLSDARSNDIDAKSRKRSIAELLGLPLVNPQQHEPRRDDELQTFRVDCEIVKYKLEDDGDVHLVIQDPNDPASHMVAEIPDPECPDAVSGGHAYQFKVAREMLFDLFAAHPPSSRMQSVLPAKRVTITGVGFYDFPHHQTGAAANNLELHPVVKLEVGR